MVGVKFDEKNKSWSCIEELEYWDSDVSFGTFLLDMLSSHGYKTAQVNHDTGVEMTFNELRLKTIWAAQSLQKKGFQYKDVFSFMAVNSENLCPIVFASFCLGCLINPLHVTLSKEEISQILKNTKSKAIFCDIDSYNLIDEALKESEMNVQIFTFDGHIFNSEPVNNLFIETGNENEFVPIHVDVLNDIAAIFSSSGTTGPSKCVAIPYVMIYSHVSRILIKDDICLSFEPFYWTVWLYYIITCSVKGSTRIITRHSFSAELQLEMIEKYKVTALCATSSYMTTCIKNENICTNNLSSVRVILVLGGKIFPSVAIETYRYYPNAKIAAMYGLTELGTVFEYILDSNGNYNAVGLYNGVTVKIIDENGNRCGPNIDGEICTNKKYRFIEYLNNPKTTAAAFDEEGFFLTGDIGHFDGNGTLHIIDRKKDVFNIFYFEAPLSPSEMESYLITLPDVKEICIVGISTSIDEELPAAVIVRNSNSSLSEKTFYESVTHHFPSRMWLRGGVYFVDSLPKTPSGKIIRGKVTELATEKFHLAGGINDPLIQTYISDIPEEVRKLIIRNTE